MNLNVYPKVLFFSAGDYGTAAIRTRVKLLRLWTLSAGVFDSIMPTLPLFSAGQSASKMANAS